MGATQQAIETVQQGASELRSRFNGLSCMTVGCGVVALGFLGMMIAALIAWFSYTCAPFC